MTNDSMALVKKQKLISLNADGKMIFSQYAWE